MGDNIHYEFARLMFSKLCERVNGKVIYEIYRDVDTIIFKINFKQFNFRYAIGNVTQRMCEGRVDDAVEEIVTRYRGVVLKAFFKNKEN